MLLHSKKSPRLNIFLRRLVIFFHKLSTKKKIILAIGFVFFLGLLSLLLMLAKVGIRNKLHLLYNQTNAKIHSQWIRLFSDHPEVMIIDIPFENYQKIMTKREAAISQKVLLSTDDDFVNATIQYQDKKSPIEIRLKGDWTDHLESDKWSFRIKIKDESAIMGMKKFSIQAPETREYIQEWLFHQAAKKEGLIALRYDFVDVIVNGEKKGIFAIEEHFSKELLEHNQRRESPILKFDESQFWETMVRYDFKEEIERGIELRTPVVAFQTNKVLSDESMSDQAAQGQKLLNDFRMGQSTVGETFASNQWAKFFALSDLLGQRHGLSTHNIRFYYNPITGLIEPIPYDLQPGKIINRLSNDLDYMSYDLVTKIFEDPDFEKNYNQELARISQDSYVNNFLSSIDEDLKIMVNYINHDEPYTFDQNSIRQNAKFIQKKLAEKPNIRAYISEDGNLMVLPLTEFSSHIVSVTNNNDQIIWQAPSTPIIVGGTRRDFVRQPTEIKVDYQAINQLSSPTDLKVNYQVLGKEKVSTILVEPWILGTSDYRITNPTLVPYFAIYQAKDNTYIVPTGNWQISTNWVLPRGSKLMIEAGATIDLVDHASIVVNGPIFIKGQDNNPVIITSSNKTGGGIFVYDANEYSIISYAKLENLSNPISKSQTISGSVNFYKAPVSIDNSQFTNMNSEDGINIVNSTFSMQKTVVSHTFSDGIDLDFSDGSLEDVKIFATGNDGFDISGSKVVTGNLDVSDVGDKGVSVGEISSISLENCRISGARIAIAIKDSSHLDSNNCEIKDSQYGIVAYQKKPEYGPASMKIISIGNFADQAYLLEEDTYAFVGWGLIPTTDKKVYEFLYPNE